METRIGKVRNEPLASSVDRSEQKWLGVGEWRLETKREADGLIT